MVGGPPFVPRGLHSLAALAMNTQSHSYLRDLAPSVPSAWTLTFLGLFLPSFKFLFKCHFLSDISLFFASKVALTTFSP